VRFFQYIQQSGLVTTTFFTAFLREIQLDILLENLYSADKNYSYLIIIIYFIVKINFFKKLQGGVK